MNRKKIKAPKLHKRNEKYKSEKYKDNNIAPPPLMDMTLQTMIGNQEVQRLFKMHEIMAKLLISQSGDVYEQEANRIAEKIVNIKDPPQTTPNSSITEIIVGSVFCIVSFVALTEFPVKLCSS